MGDGDGRLFQLGRHVRQLRDPARGRQGGARGRSRARLPTQARGRRRRTAADPEEDPGRHRARLRPGEVEGVTAAQLADALEQAVPGAVSAHEDAIDMPTLTLHRERLVEACLILRDQHGKNFLSAVTAVDYLGYGEEVAGYFGSDRGRDINRTGSWGAPETAPPMPTRF